MRVTTVLHAVSRNSESWVQVLGLIVRDSWVRCDVVQKWVWVSAYLTLLALLMSLSRATMVMSRNSES